MLKNLIDPKEAREAMLSLLSTAGTLAGIAVGLVGFYLIFFAVRDVSAARTWRMLEVIDIVFLGSMTLMVLAGFIVVYTLM